jgi:chaperonin GroES
MMKDIRPLYDQILVKRVEAAEEVAYGGIIIPDIAKERPQEGEVLAVGSGRVLRSGIRIPVAVNIGNRILMERYVGTEIRIEDQEYLIIREADVLGVFMSESSPLPGNPPKGDYPKPNKDRSTEIPDKKSDKE